MKTAIIAVALLISTITIIIILVIINMISMSMVRALFVKESISLVGVGDKIFQLGILIN